ncbi:MAG TPA: YfiR family protein [Gallionellaceae bacterium]
MYFRLCRASLFLLLILPGASHAAPISEYQLKSAFLYNFATFLDWPGSMGTSLTLCVAVPEDALKYFTMLEGKPVGNSKVTVRRLTADDSAEGCRILFVAESESGSFEDWLTEVGDEQVLTVAESELWLKKGVVLDLMIQEKRVVFDVNVDAARGEGIIINSRLLRLARKVYGLGSGDEPAEK